MPVRVHAPRPSSWNRGGFEHDDAHARVGQRNGGGHARVPGTDDRYAVIQVFHAIQNLRSGVSEVRCVSTRKPSRSISSSSAR